MGLVGDRFDHQPKPLIWRVFNQSLRTCVQRKPTAAYARTQQNTQILLYRGSYSPTVGSKVGLHKGFNAHKAPDSPIDLFFPNKIPNFANVEVLLN